MLLRNSWIKDSRRCDTIKQVRNQFRYQTRSTHNANKNIRHLREVPTKVHKQSNCTTWSSSDSRDTQTVETKHCFWEVLTAEKASADIKLASYCVDRLRYQSSLGFCSAILIWRSSIQFFELDNRRRRCHKWKDVSIDSRLVYSRIARYRTVSRTFQPNNRWLLINRQFNTCTSMWLLAR